MATAVMRIKAKDKTVVVDKRMYERDRTVGFTKSEARGVFGSCSKPKDEVKERIEDYERRKFDRLIKDADLRYKPSRVEAKRIEEYMGQRQENELAYYKEKHAGVKERMRKRQEKAMRKVMAMKPR